MLVVDMEMSEDQILTTAEVMGFDPEQIMTTEAFEQATGTKVKFRPSLPNLTTRETV